MSVLRIQADGATTADSLQETIAALRAHQAELAGWPIRRLLALWDDFSGRLLSDPRTRAIEGIAFLAAWLRRQHFEEVVNLNLQGQPEYLDQFIPRGRALLAARPHGLAAMWMPGNVGTLPMFSLALGLTAKNVCLVKLAQPEPQGMDHMLAVLAESAAEGRCGADLVRAAAVVWFDYRDRQRSEEMSLAADARIVWGGATAVREITALPRHEHCVDLVFGPKYSIGVIDRKRLEGDPQALDEAVAAFVRDIAAFDQRACSSPQTIFIEANSRCALRDVGELFARHLARLPPKPGLDAHTTLRILDARAQWAIAAETDVLASADGTNWTVCMDRSVSLKEAVGSRTVFLTEVDCWREIIPLLTPKVQTVGIAFADREDAVAFAEAATLAGVARCVRPGLMNAFELPWDGKLLLGQLVRWVTLRP